MFTIGLKYTRKDDQKEKKWINVWYLVNYNHLLDTLRYTEIAFHFKIHLVSSALGERNTPILYMW